MHTKIYVKNLCQNTLVILISVGHLCSLNVNNLKTAKMEKNC